MKEVFLQGQFRWAVIFCKYIANEAHLMILKLTAGKGLAKLPRQQKRGGGRGGRCHDQAPFIINKYLILTLLYYIIANIIFTFRSVSDFLT